MYHNLATQCTPATLWWGRGDPSSCRLTWCGRGRGIESDPKLGTTGGEIQDWGRLVSCPTRWSLYLYLGFSNDHLSQHPDNRETGYSNVTRGRSTICSLTIENTQGKKSNNPKLGTTGRKIQNWGGSTILGMTNKFPTSGNKLILVFWRETYFVETVSCGRLLVHTADTPHGPADVCKTFACSTLFQTFAKYPHPFSKE